MFRRSNLLMATSALIVMIAASLFSGRSESAASPGDDFAEYQLDVFCVPGQAATAVFVTKGDGVMGRHWMCAGWCEGRMVMIADKLAAEAPPNVRDRFNEAIRTHERDAAIGIGQSIAGCGGYPKAEKSCEKYSGVISCDCNGDGKDDVSKSFESCGPPSNFPRSFKSTCQDWATGDGGYTYGTDSTILRAGRDWLRSLSCPTLDCYQQYKACEQRAENRYQKCIFGKKFVSVNRRCTRNLRNDSAKCEPARDVCLKSIRRFGPGTEPQPQPLPAPTRTP